jgi:hypothetical protein
VRRRSARRGFELGPRWEYSNLWRVIARETYNSLYFTIKRPLGTTGDRRPVRRGIRMCSIGLFLEYSHPRHNIWNSWRKNGVIGIEPHAAETFQGPDIIPTTCISTAVVGRRGNDTHAKACDDRSGDLLAALHWYAHAGRPLARTQQKFAAAELAAGNGNGEPQTPTVVVTRNCASACMTTADAERTPLASCLPLQHSGLALGWCASFESLLRKVVQ